MWIVEIFPVGEEIGHIGGIRRGSWGILDVGLNWGKCKSPSAGWTRNHRRVLRGVVRSSHASECEGRVVRVRALEYAEGTLCSNSIATGLAVV